jgi:hypothetical protein
MEQAIFSSQTSLWQNEGDLPLRVVVAFAASTLQSMSRARRAIPDATDVHAYRTAPAALTVRQTGDLLGTLLNQQLCCDLTQLTQAQVEAKPIAHHTDSSRRSRPGEKRQSITDWSGAAQSFAYQ